MLPNGWLILDKPLHLSSTQASNRIRRHFKLEKLGHIGTLDPLASGVLILAIGEATKLIPYLPIKPKTYEFEICWGEARETDDAEGKVTHTSSYYPTPDEIKDSICGFLGEINQIPPIYSAIKKNGQPAYKLARKGQTPFLTGRKIFIYDLKLTSMVNERISRFEVKCSSGTYVRSLARDLALSLQTYGYIYSLRRTQDSFFHIQDTFPLEKILEISHNSKEYPFIKTLEAVLDDIPAVSLTENEAQRIRQGLSIDSVCFQHLSPIALFFNGRLLAMAISKEGRVFPQRVFNLV